MENYNAQAGDSCDGGPISLNSTCCRNDLYISCSRGRKCTNHDSLESEEEGNDLKVKYYKIRMFFQNNSSIHRP